MEMTLTHLATLVGGQLRGDGNLKIEGAATLGSVAANQITLVDAAQRLAEWHSSVAAAAVVPDDLPAQQQPTIAVADVHAAFALIVAQFRPPKSTPAAGISPAATICPTARLADDVAVHANATIGARVTIGRGTTIHSGVHILDDCVIGADVTVFPNAILYDNTRVGSRSIIHAGAVLGAYGFGYDSTDRGHRRTAQLGWVEIGADVEIGACATIDRGTYDATVVGEGTKIDNHVMIGHNCRLGRHNMICSQVGIAGSTTTGDFVVMAGQVGVRDHVHIGTGAVLGAKAGVSNDVAAGARMIGIPATPEREQKIKQAALAKLPEMRKQWKQMLRRMAVDKREPDSDQGPNQAAA